MNESRTTGYYQDAYQESSPFGARPPWDIGEAQKVFVDLSRTGAIKGHVLDAGCGAGEIALFLASEGHTVTGVDLSETAIAQARQRAIQRGSDAQFAVGSVLDLSEYAGRFDTVVDCGCFHALPKAELGTYTAALHQATAPGAVAYMLEMSADARTVVKSKFASIGIPEQVRAAFAPLHPEDLRNAFAEGWAEESLDASVIQVRFPGNDGLTDLPAWLGVFRRL
jgi:SAM-dependent methyltransferase